MGFKINNRISVANQKIRAVNLGGTKINININKTLPIAIKTEKHEIQYANGNPKGWGIPSIQCTPKHVVANVDRLFNSPSLPQMFPSLDQAFVRLKLHQDSGIMIDNGDETPFLKVKGGRIVARTCGNLYWPEKTVINSMIIKYDSNKKWEEPLKEFMELGMSENVFGLREFIQSQAFLTSGLTIGTGDLFSKPYALIPGTYKHYMKYDTFIRAEREGFIRASVKEEHGMRDNYVYLTMLSLRPKEANFIFWTEGERQLAPDRADFVITFDLKNHSPLKIEYSKDDPFVECWTRGNLNLNDVNIIYSGENDTDMIRRASGQ